MRARELVGEGDFDGENLSATGPLLPPRVVGREHGGESGRVVGVGLTLGEASQRLRSGRESTRERPGHVTLTDGVPPRLQARVDGGAEGERARGWADRFQPDLVAVMVGAGAQLPEAEAAAGEQVNAAPE